MIGILLAAGRGTRMKNEKPKVLFDVNEEPLAFASLKSLFEICDKVAVVVGYKGPDVEKALMSRAIEVFGEKVAFEKIQFVTQDPPRGTGDAVKTAIAGLGKKFPSQGEALVVNGDLPLIRKETLERLVKAFRDGKLSSACLSMRMLRPAGLGRILRDQTGVFTGIREEKDANTDERAIREVNGGVYCFDAKLLAEAVQSLNSKNKQGEFYLTDLLGNRGDRARRSEAVMLRTHWDLLGVNTTYELVSVRRIAQGRLQKRICEDFGVDMLDPATTYISARAEFKGASRIGPGTVLRGKTIVGGGVEIDGQCFFENARLDTNAHILWGSVVRDSIVGEGAHVGPMAHLRPGTELGPEVKVGNFVELKKTHMGRGAKASHLSYLGDAKIGAGTNVGCGTITCNYDGFNKHETIIGDNAFIGSDSQLVAPVKIGDGAYVASGTTVTKDVPAGALAISRTPITIKDGYATRLTERFKARAKSKGK